MRGLRFIAVAFAIVLVSCAKGGSLESVDVATFKKILKEYSVVLLDVRTPKEFAAGHIEGALNINVADSLFSDNIDKIIPPKCTIAVYCRSGRRSLTAGDILVQKGYKVINLEGGILAWEEAK